jgi:hypothetical protein
MEYKLQYMTLGSDNAPYVVFQVKVDASDSDEAFALAKAAPWPEGAVRWSLLDDTGREIASHTPD